MKKPIHQYLDNPKEFWRELQQFKPSCVFMYCNDPFGHCTRRNAVKTEFDRKMHIACYKRGQLLNKYPPEEIIPILFYEMLEFKLNELQDLNKKRYEIEKDRLLVSAATTLKESLEYHYNNVDRINIVANKEIIDKLKQEFGINKKHKKQSIMHKIKKVLNLI